MVLHASVLQYFLLPSPSVYSQFRTHFEIFASHFSISSIFISIATPNFTLKVIANDKDFNLEHDNLIATI